MQQLHSIEECLFWRKLQKGTVGFVPTMGALHKGHLSLVKLSKHFCDNTLVSIFVNPLQFAPTEDFDSYPKTIEQDIKLLQRGGADAVFLPTEDQMYKQFHNTSFFESALSFKLEGRSRPHFFKGVTTIVDKFFNIINPTHTVFGQKDAQQLLIIKKMIKIKNYNITLIEGPTVREKSGLALSSRNNCFSKEEKKTASNIYQGLLNVKNSLNCGENQARFLKQIFKNHIKKFPLLKIDYISIACINTLDEILGVVDKEVLVSTAVFFKSVRLIDNFSYSPST